MNNTALTLLELLIVIVIIAFITGVGLTAFSIVDVRKVDADARKILADLNLAREMAAGRHQSYKLTFYLSDNEYAFFQGSTEIKRERLDMNYAVSLTDFSGNPVVPEEVNFNFPPLTAQSRLITLNYPGRLAKTVRVFSATGYAKID